MQYSALSSDDSILVVILSHSRLPWQPYLIVLLETIHIVDSLNIYLL